MFPLQICMYIFKNLQFKIKLKQNIIDVYKEYLVNMSPRILFYYYKGK